jgi:hypothetical protein
MQIPTFLEGKHRYTLAYSVQRVMGFFDTYDEFYWNVTGNGWVFPIEKASIQDGVSNRSRNWETMPDIPERFGAQGQGLSGRSRGDSVFVGGNQRLRCLPNEGFTVAAAIPKGFVHAPTEAQKLALFLKDNRVWVIFFASSVFLFVFLFVAWWKKGRDSSWDHHSPL